MPPDSHRARESGVGRVAVGSPPGSSVHLGRHVPVGLAHSGYVVRTGRGTGRKSVIATGMTRQCRDSWPEVYTDPSASNPVTLILEASRILQSLEPKAVTPTASSTSTGERGPGDQSGRTSGRSADRERTKGISRLDRAKLSYYALPLRALSLAASQSRKNGFEKK